MFVLWDLFTKKSTLSEKDYLALFEKKEPIKPEASQKKSFQYLQDLNKYLKDGSQPCKEDVLLDAIKAAKDSIANDEISKEKAFQILSYNMYRLEDMDSGIDILEYQDDRGNALHHLIQLGDEWYLMVEKLISIREQLKEISDKQHYFPLGLAADKKAYDIFMHLYQMRHKPDVLVQCLQPEYQEQFQNYDLSDITRFIKENFDLSKVKLPALVAEHDRLRNIYLNLKVFGSKYYSLFDRLEEQGSVFEIQVKVVEEQAEKIIDDAISKMTEADLHQCFGETQETPIHAACLNQASVVVKALLKRVVILSGDEPQKVMQEHLSKASGGYTAYEFAFPKLRKEIENKIIPSILKELELENRPHSPSMTNP